MCVATRAFAPCEAGGHTVHARASYANARHAWNTITITTKDPRTAANTVGASPIASRTHNGANTSSGSVSNWIVGGRRSLDVHRQNTEYPRPARLNLETAK